MKTYFADANIFLRFLLDDIPFQAAAANYLQKAKKKKLKIIVCQIVIFEIAFNLEKLYKFSKKKTIEYLKAIVSIPFIKVNDKEIFLETLDLYSQKNIDLVDVFLFCIVKSQGAKILSFDKDFKKIK